MIEGKLKLNEAEKAMDAVMRGLSKEKTIRIAKARKAPKEGEVAPKEALITPATALEGGEAKPTPTPPPQAPSVEEITCPKCGEKAKVYWNERKIVWQQ